MSVPPKSVAVPALDLEGAVSGDPRRDRTRCPAGDREPDVRPGPGSRAARGRAGRVLRRRPRDRLRLGDRRAAPAPDGAGDRARRRGDHDPLHRSSPRPARSGGPAPGRSSWTSSPTPTTSTPPRSRRPSRRGRGRSSRSTSTARPPTWTRSTRSPGRYGLFVLEDAAQAIGAAYQGRRAGSARPGRGLQLLPVQEPGRLRRRRPDDHRRPGARPEARPAARPRHGAEVPPPRGRDQLPARRPPGRRPPRQAPAPRRLDRSGRREAAARYEAPVPRPTASTDLVTLPVERPGHLPRLQPVRHPRAGRGPRRAARVSDRPARSGPRSTTRSRSTCSPASRRSATSPATSPSPKRPRARRSPCRCIPS